MLLIWSNRGRRHHSGRGAVRRRIMTEQSQSITGRRCHPKLQLGWHHVIIILDLAGERIVILVLMLVLMAVHLELGVDSVELHLRLVDLPLEAEDVAHAAVNREEMADVSLPYDGMHRLLTLGSKERADTRRCTSAAGTCTQRRRGWCHPSTSCLSASHQTQERDVERLSHSE